MTEAGYRLTRWADDFVVVCHTTQLLMQACEQFILSFRERAADDH